MRRRELLLGGGALAALAGLSACSRGAEPPAAFWSQSWESPNGQPLAAADLRGRPLLVNFWATWCPPCVEELPLLDQFYQSRRAQGWQLLGLAIDQPSAVRAFLARRPLSFPIGLAGLGGTELSRELGNSNGGLPFSVLFDPAGRLVERKLGRLHAEDLERWQRL
ncbi:TlpA disulfide reductase family protein [Malikia granosa]|uniref:Redoxin n=1 Tax=Malikia granosa TaxID=263067 RepID=A0A2S9K8W2_9BURK|nr:TlpA disulfide reductase family protein [Malikia granosa]PRD66832.1 redoxin [Malikia granosa]